MKDKSVKPVDVQVLIEPNSLQEKDETVDAEEDSNKGIQETQNLKKEDMKCSFVIKNQR